MSTRLTNPDASLIVRHPTAGVRRRTVAVVGMLAVWLLLAACKQRDWRDRPEGAVDRPRPQWVDVEPVMPGHLAFGRGRNHFDDPLGQIRSPLRSEAMARQSVAVHLRPAMRDVAELLIDSLPEPDAPPGPTGPVGPDGAAGGSSIDAPQRIRREREMRELIDTLSREISRETARSAVVVDRWFDDATRTWHTLAASPVEESLFRLQLTIRDRVPDARDVLLPTHACRIRLAGMRMEAPNPMRRRDVEPALDETIWPRPQPNEPGTAMYAGAEVASGRADASAATADQIARSRLAERVARVARAALLEWAEATRPKDGWLGDDRADDIAAAAGCDAAESASVLTMAAHPAPDVRDGDADWLLVEMRRRQPTSPADTAGRGLPWYSPMSLRPRITRVLLRVPFETVASRLFARMRQAADEADEVARARAAETPDADGQTEDAPAGDAEADDSDAAAGPDDGDILDADVVVEGERPTEPAADDAASRSPRPERAIPQEAQLRSILASAQGRVLGHHPVDLAD